MKGPCYMESFADNIVPRKPVGIRINTCTTVVVVQLELEINHAFTQKAIFTGITGMKNFPGFFSLSLFHNWSCQLFEINLFSCLCLSLQETINKTIFTPRKHSPLLLLILPLSDIFILFHFRAIAVMQYYRLLFFLLLLLLFLLLLPFLLSISFYPLGSSFQSSFPKG